MYFKRKIPSLIEWLPENDTNLDELRLSDDRLYPLIDECIHLLDTIQFWHGDVENRDKFFASPLAQKGQKIFNIVSGDP